MNKQNQGCPHIISGFILFFLLVIILPSLSFCAQALPDKDCLQCHDDFKVQEYNASVHASNQCVSCHKDVSRIPHPEKLAKVDCSACHSVESQVYNVSDHGKAFKAGLPAASCLDCHGSAHAILGASNDESPVFHLNIPKTCAKCHEDEKKMALYNLLEKKPVLSYSQTVHGKAIAQKGLTKAAACTDCHGSHDSMSPLNPKSKIYRLNVPGTCGRCHDNILSAYLRGIHGKSAMAGKPDAPVCTDCHGEHTIKSHKDPKSSVYSTVIAEKTCGQCHAAQRIINKYGLPADRLETYFQSYHGLASKYGVTSAANCTSCHEAHEILPSSDPNSSVYKDNLPRTCGKCHQNAGAGLTKASVHISPSQKQNKAVYYVTLFYIFFIIMTVGGMLAHNIIYFIPKLREHYRRHKQEAAYTRFSGIERLQHFLLVISFILLAYTGFALRFRSAWWALPFTVWNPGFDWRGIIHRVMAVIFCALALYHVYYLLLTERGRKQLKALLPKIQDFLYFFKMIRYNLGILQQKPGHERYNYVEKVEYWALVWGSVVMVTTGSMLTFKDFFLRYFPKWILDVAATIHFYEAVLAVLAILIWHFYFVIFDPDCYPINFSMITGKVIKERHRKDSDSEVTK